MTVALPILVSSSATLPVAEICEEHMHGDKRTCRRGISKVQQGSKATCSVFGGMQIVLIWQLPGQGMCYGI
jgi:hypothetical protein